MKFNESNKESFYKNSQYKNINTDVWERASFKDDRNRKTFIRKLIKFLKVNTSFKGRVNRMYFWLFEAISIPLILIFHSMEILHSDFNRMLIDNFIVGNLTYNEVIFIGTVTHVIIKMLLVYTVIMSISVAIRRLHDINKRGWWLLLLFVPLGYLILLFFYCKKGTDGTNRFGSEIL